MAQKDTEKLYKVFNDSTELLENSLNVSYLDAFIESANNMLDDNHVKIEDGYPDDETVDKLEKLYQQVNYSKIDSDDVRKAIQFTMIKAIQEDKIQANHQITPDTIAMIMGYLLTRIFKNHSSVDILDLTVGAGNLLTSVMNQLRTSLHEKVYGAGIDNDDSLLSVAGISAEMQRLHVELMHQDSLNNLVVNNVDLAISDLPIGYYPIDENTKNYKTRSTEGHSYAHHLLIEQAMNHVKPNGYGVFLVPSNMFKTKEAKALLKWLQGNSYLQAMLNLPKELFNNVNAQKAIMILQRHGDKAKQANQIMIGEFPSFKNTSAFQKFIAEVIEWERNDLLR